MSRASRVNWSFGQIDKLRKAIDKYNRVIDKLDKMKDYGVYDYIPLRTSLIEEMENITTLEDLSRRINELEKITSEEQQEVVIIDA